MKIISRAEAKELGLKRYFTGVACFRGHLCELHVSQGKCVQCKKEDVEKYNAKNRDLILKNSRIRRANRTDEEKSIQSSKKKIWKAKNIDEIKRKDKIYFEKNKEKISESRKLYYLENKDKKSSWAKNYRLDNLEMFREKEAIKRVTKKEDIKKANAKWYKKTSTARKEYRQSRKARRNELDKIYRATPEGKMVSFCRSGIDRIVKMLKQDKKIRTIKSLHYTIDDLKEHIEKQFDIMMTWKNHGHKGWHIDHKESLIKLVRLHKDKTQEEIFNIVNSLDNLQPMWAIDNLYKGSN